MNYTHFLYIMGNSAWLRWGTLTEKQEKDLLDIGKRGIKRPKVHVSVCVCVREKLIERHLHKER